MLKSVCVCYVLCVFIPRLYRAGEMRFGLTTCTDYFSINVAGPWCNKSYIDTNGQGTIGWNCCGIDWQPRPNEDCFFVFVPEIRTIPSSVCLVPDWRRLYHCRSRGEQSR
jgi:hypothetical protein